MEVQHLEYLLILVNFMLIWLRRNQQQNSIIFQWFLQRNEDEDDLDLLFVLKHNQQFHLNRQRRRLAKIRAVIEGELGQIRRRRLIWMHDRPQIWWEEMDQCHNDVIWKSHFRMGEETFNYIVNAVTPYIMRVPSKFRMPISVRKRVAITLWRLATGADYRSIQELFGVGKSTACEIFYEVVMCISQTLKKKFLRHPTPDEFLEIAQGFREKWGFPLCVGALDGSHVPIIAPSEHRNDYYNRKGFYSIIMQAVIDHKYMFWDILAGWPGKVHDSRVLANSRIYELANNGSLFGNYSERFGGVDVPFVILGDAAYPLCKWLMRPYRENAATPESQKYFNYRLSRARMCVECGFGRLKGRWRCLLKRNDCHISLMPHIVMASAILHNLCEKRGENLDEDLIIPPPPPQNVFPNNPHPMGGCTSRGQCNQRCLV